MVTCRRCGAGKPQEEFPKNGKDKDGNVRYRVNCKTCYNIERKLTQQKSVTKFLNNTKKRTGEVGTYTLQDWRDVMVHFKGACAYCGVVPTRSKKLQRDHIVAVNCGGTTIRKNIAPACQSCNSSKGDKPVMEWMKVEAQKELVNSWTSQV